MQKSLYKHFEASFYKESYYIYSEFFCKVQKWKGILKW
jgi:hypothetical protein